MRGSYLTFGQPLIEEEKIEEVLRGLRGAWLSTGPEVAIFEKLIAEYKGVEHAVAARSCGVNRASRRTSKRSMAHQIQASALATVFS